MLRKTSAGRKWDSTVASVTEPPGVLFVINDLGMGGAERALLTYVNHLRALRPVVALMRPVLDLLPELKDGVERFTLSGTLPERGVDEADRTARRRRGEPRGRMLLETPGLLRQALRLVRLARVHRCRVVSTFLNRSHTLALLAKFFIDPRLRVVINVHEMLSDHLEIHFAPVERRVMRAFIRLAFPRAEAIVAVSDGVRCDLVSHFGLPPECITIVHNPIDVIRIRQASQAAEAVGTDETLIVAVGRLVRLKGFDVLIRAFARLPARLGAQLLIIGDGEERPALEDLVEELGVSDRVAMPGAQNNPWTHMARASVVALSSRTEAFPSVIGEALALGRPVVATRCSQGVTEYLEDGRCGLLVPPDDVEAMAEALERLLSDGELCNRLARQGLRRIESFELPLAVRRYERVLDGVCRGSGEPTPG